MDHWVTAAVGFLAGTCLVLWVRFDSLRKMQRLFDIHRRLFHQSPSIGRNKSAAIRPLGVRK